MVSFIISNRLWQSESCEASNLKTFGMEYVKSFRSNELLSDQVAEVNMVRLCSTKYKKWQFLMLRMWQSLVIHLVSSNQLQKEQWCKSECVQQVSWTEGALLKT